MRHRFLLIIALCFTVSTPALLAQRGLRSTARLAEKLVAGFISKPKRTGILFRGINIDPTRLAEVSRPQQFRLVESALWRLQRQEPNLLPQLEGLIGDTNSTAQEYERFANRLPVPIEQYRLKWPRDQAYEWSSRPIELTVELAVELAVSSNPVFHIQSRLAELNYYQGRLDGIRGPRTERAIRAFQRDHALKVDGIVGPRTVRSLDHVTHVRRLHQEDDQGFRAYALEKPDGRTLYSLHGDDGLLKYRGNDAEKLLESIEQDLQGSSIEMVYIDMSGFSVPKVDAFKSTVRIKELSRPFRVLGGNKSFLIDNSEYFSNGVALGRVEPIKVASDGRYYFDFSFEGRSGDQGWVRITARVRDLLSRFRDLLKDFLFPAGSFRSDRSLESTLREIRRELRVKYKLSDEELTVELLKEFRPIEVVELDFRAASKSSG